MSRVTTPVGERSRTKQSFKDSTNINTIVERHRVSGEAPPFNNETPLYGDFSNATDLHSSMNRVSAAEDSFATLKATIRDASDNSPVRFLEMLETQQGKDTLHKAGLDLGPEFTPTPPALPDPKPVEAGITPEPPVEPSNPSA